VHENVLRVKSVDELWSMLRDRTGRPGYKANYGTEADFEADVWKRVIDLARDLGLDVEPSCLTSHAIHRERSASAWREFLREPAGPDVKALGSHNRLDVVLRHPSHGSIGIEVKYLGPTGHAGKLTQALGQALLMLRASNTGSSAFANARRRCVLPKRTIENGSGRNSGRQPDEKRMTPGSALEGSRERLRRLEAGWSGGPPAASA
jgi:hypothetical protein